MRKLIVLPMAILMCLFIVTPAFAFTSDSFVIDTNPYLFKNIQSSSFSLRDSASYAISESSSSDSSSPDFLLDSSPLMDVMVGGIINGPVIDSPFADIYTVSPVFSWSGSNADNATWLARNAFTWKPKDSQSYKSLVLSMVSFRLTLDSLSADAISFCGALRPRSVCWSPYSFSTFFTDCVIYVNGDKVHSISANSNGFFEFNNYIYSSSSVPISSVSLEFTGGGSYELRSDITSVTPTFQTNLQSYDRRNFKFSVLSDDNVLNGFNDNAQDAMNQHDAIESQWTGSMTENFNNLSLSDFSFPVAAVTGFTLISGIFNDLWNAMGDFRIVYVFPLTLGVVLLLIGRLSRTSVKRSSGRGDDDA